jgi:hypothetical protein
MYTLTTHARGNPDLAQDPNVPPHGVTNLALYAPTLLELQSKVIAWIAANNLGSGNWWANTLVVRLVKTRNRRSGRTHTAPELVGHMSYDGRVWTGNSIEVLPAHTAPQEG